MIQKFEKGKKTQLTKNFSSTEFDCSCQCQDCTQTLIDSELIQKLQAKRNQWNKPIKINSGFLGILGGIVAFFFYRIFRKASRFKELKKENKQLAQENQDLRKSSALQQIRERNHVETMVKISQDNLSADEYTRLLSDYPKDNHETHRAQTGAR